MHLSAVQTQFNAQVNYGTPTHSRATIALYSCAVLSTCILNSVPLPSDLLTSDAAPAEAFPPSHLPPIDFSIWLLRAPSSRRMSEPGRGPLYRREAWELDVVPPGIGLVPLSSRLRDVFAYRLR